MPHSSHKGSLIQKTGLKLIMPYPIRAELNKKTIVTRIVEIILKYVYVKIYSKMRN